MRSPIGALLALALLAPAASSLGVDLQAACDGDLCGAAPSACAVASPGVNKCSFSCSAGQTVHARAAGSGVSIAAPCGGADVGCSSESSCSDEGKATSSGRGECELGGTGSGYCYAA